MQNEELRELEHLRNELASDSKNFCRRCFEGGAICQNPPNVFRVFPRRTYPKFFFVFDKPNDNDPFFCEADPDMPDFAPIELFDRRSIKEWLPEDLKPHAFEGNPSGNNLVRLLDEWLKIPHKNLCSPHFHITNVVKCDKCCETGRTKDIKIRISQARRCVEHFFFRELKLLRPEVLVIFGRTPFDFLRPFMTFDDQDAKEMWHVFDAEIDGRRYRAVRVPHTASRSFNPHQRGGGGGRNYISNLPDDFWSVERGSS